MLNADATSRSSLICTDPPFSFFQLTEDLAPSSVNGRTARKPLHRLFSLMRKMSVRSYLRESLHINKELAEEREMLRQACGTDVTMDAERVTCFSTMPPAGADWRDQRVLNDEDILGYAVVIRVTAPTDVACSYVYESVVPPPSMLVTFDGSPPCRTAVSNYYVHNSRQFRTSIGPKKANRELPISGSFFAQQNGSTHVCAHAALRMAVNSSPLFASQEKLTNKVINDTLSLAWEEIPKGLDHQQMKSVIEAVGGTVQLANFYKLPSMEYDHFIYPLMESGCPVILNVHGLSFPAPQSSHQSEEFGHALAVMGHTLNTDRWDPEARSGYRAYARLNYMPAVSWTDHLIINDDNLGMYVTLPTDSMRNLIIPQKNPSHHAAEALGIVPKRVRLSGLMAEQRAASFFASWRSQVLSAITPPPYWLTRLIQGPLVCRTVLQTRRNYLLHLQSTLALIGQELDPTVKSDLKRLPPQIWVTELTLPQLYMANRHKVADVIIDAGADANIHERGKSLVAVRLPGYFVLFRAQKSHAFPITGHTPLITNDSGVRLCDW